MSISAAAWLYEDPNRRGRIFTRAIGESQRYELISSTDLRNSYFARTASSASVASGSGFFTSLICFGSRFPFDGLDYTGPFLQLTSDGPEFISDLNAFNFDDFTTSALLVRRGLGKERRISFDDLFHFQWETALRKTLENKPAIPDPDKHLLLTWSMFPTGIPGLNPSLRYLMIYQPLQVDASPWAYRYKAAFTYWLLFSLDSGGVLQGHVARASFWVDEGAVHDCVVAGMVNAVLTDGPATLSTEIELQLDAVGLKKEKFTDLYYLPGRQVEAPSPGVITGSTSEDVTIVLQE